jgi:competence protein ComFB
METAVRVEFEKQIGAHQAGAINLIRSALKALLQESSASRILCRCPWCRNDVLALSLSKLPPCYCQSHHYGMSLQKIEPRRVQGAVADAVRRVGGRPRHSQRDMVPDEGEIRLIDFRMREGSRIVEPLLGKIEEACSCDSCRSDVLAYALNRLAPRYGVVMRGKIRLRRHDMEFIRHETLRALAESARKIAANPRHKGKGTA